MTFTVSSSASRRAGTTRPERKRAVQLSKYYTRLEVAQECSSLLERFLSQDTILIEPSAGSGAFVASTQRPLFAYDIDPDHPEIITHDFLKGEIAPVFREIGDIALVGNPPFGYRSSLAVQFLNRGFEIAHTVGFILPMSFRRWDAQRRVDPRARLVLDHDLPDDAFTLLGRPFRLRCAFQVWTLLDTYPDLRLREAPPTAHPDFHIMEYCPDSPPSQRHFASPWDFAVRFQGDHDYGRVYSPRDCHPRHHWMMFNAKNEGALRRLLRIDFSALSRSRPVIPGFARSDVVSAYSAMTGARQAAAA